jgi:hypothetical protein
VHRISRSKLTSNVLLFNIFQLSYVICLV